MGPLFARGVLALFAVTLPLSIHGQTYPTKPVRFVVPFVPGGPTDIQGRMLGEKLGQRLIALELCSAGMIAAELVFCCMLSRFCILHDLDRTCEADEAFDAASALAASLDDEGLTDLLYSERRARS